MNVSVNQSDILKANILLGSLEMGVPMVIARAVNKTQTGVRTDISKEVRKSHNIKAGAVRKQVKIYKMFATNLTAKTVTGVDAAGRAVEGRGLGLPVIGYSGLRQTGKGVTVKIKKSGGRKLIPGAFVATMPFRSGVGRMGGAVAYQPGGKGNTRSGGHVGVFRREFKLKGVSRQQGHGTVGRLPIKEIFTSSIVDVLSNEPIMVRVLESARQRLDKNMAHETDYMLSRL